MESNFQNRPNLFVLHSDTQITKKRNFALTNFDVMSFIKSHLKAARDHIDKKDYLTAKKEAIQVLDFEPDNYNASAAM